MSIDGSPGPGPAGGAFPGRDVVEAVLAVASRAPSIHNTQPWEWVLRDDALELRADRTRRLSVADPDGHSLLISCGAAACLTELALRAAGWDVSTEHLPDPGDPDLLARFSDAREAPASEDDRAAVEAALSRRSDRRPFTPDPLPEDIVEQLREAAQGQEVYAHFPMRADEQLDLAVAVSWADRVERDDPAYRAEMQRWVSDAEVHTEGVPVSAVPHVEAGHPRHTDVPLRDFEVGVSGAQLIAQDVDEHPLIAVVFTRNDGAVAQLRAGEAMMRLMLTAERLGVASCPLSQAVDLGAFRSRVRTLMSWPDYPQMMLRLGYPAETPSGPRTPRRPVAAVLRDETTSSPG